MIKPKPSAKLLCIAVAAALTIGAITSASALAAEWEIEGKTLSALKLTEETTTVVGGEITIEVPGLGIEVACGKAAGSGKIIAGGKDEETVELSECTVPQMLKSCTVSEPVVSKISSTLVHHAGQPYDTLKPSGGEFTTIELTGAKCVLPESTEVEGTAAAELLSGVSAEQPLIFSEAIAKLLSTQIFFGAEPANLLGELATELSGAHAGGKWGGSEHMTTLCEIGTEGCPAETVYAASTPLEASLKSGTNAVFKGSFGTVSCSTSTLEGETTGKEAEPLPGKVAALNFSSCKLGETSCTLSSKQLPYTAAIARIGSGDGSLSLTSKEKTPGVQLECGKLIKCTASGKLELTLEGGSPGLVLAKEEPLTGEGSCSSVTLTGEYTLGKPNGGEVYVTELLAPATKLCSAEPELLFGRLKCKNATYFSGEVTGVLAVGTTAFNSLLEPSKAVFCNETSYSGEFDNNGDSTLGGIKSLAFSSFNGIPGQRCSSTFGGGTLPTVKITMEKFPYSNSVFRYRQTTGPQGVLEFGYSLKMKYDVYSEAGVFEESCKYINSRIWGDITNGTGGSSTRLSLTGYFLREAGTICPIDVNLTSTVTLKRAGGNVYIAHD